MRPCCLGLRTISLLICILYLLVHGALLALLMVFMIDPEGQLVRMMETIDTTDSRLEDSEFFQSIKRYIVEGHREYFALPITIVVVLIVSNIIAAAGSAFSHPLLLLPWLALHLLVNVFISCALVYTMVLLEDGWLQTIIFLLVAPLLTTAMAGWSVLLRMFLCLRSEDRKERSLNGVRLPATVYTPEPHNWDTPLPIWAMSPPRTVWDPIYLQHHDPRYGGGPRTPSQAQSTLSSSEHQDTLSLSSKYAGDRVSVVSVLSAGEEEEEHYSRHTVELIQENTKNFDIQGMR